MAFDADGTLWRDDLGDAFFDFVVKKGIVTQRKFAEYRRLEAQDPGKAYGFAVQCLAGMRYADVRTLARALSEAWLPSRVRPEIVALAGFLYHAGMQVHVISASADVIVRVAVNAVLGPWAPAHGIQVKTRDGVLTDQLVRPLPFGDGKVAVFRSLEAGPLVVAVGDSVHDLPMLRNARMGIWAGPGQAPAGTVAWHGS